MAGVSGALLTGRTAREQIDECVAEGASLQEIERDVIADAPLGDDGRDALWLYAWGSIERRRSVPLVSA